MKRAELFTAGTRLAFDWLGMWSERLGVSSLYLSAPDYETAQAWLWHVPATVKEIYLDEEYHSVALPDRWSIAVRPFVPAQPPPPLSVFPFTLNSVSPPFQTDHVVGCFHNILSYRPVFHPKEPYRSLRWLQHKLKREGYTLCELVGVYPPGFLWRWAMNMLCAVSFPRAADYWRQSAIEHLATRCLLSLSFSSILVFHARRIV